jgi:pimeloyl-ACP methyl ester carboxylesterase
MPSVQVDEASVAYSVSGDGPGLLLIHGTGGEGATTWSPLAQALGDSWTLVMPDLPGSGGTSDTGGKLDLAELARQMEAVAEAAGLERYSVVGFSVGAAVAAVLASNRPEGLEALVLVAGPVDGNNARVHLQFDLWRDLHRLDPQLFARLWMLTGFSPDFVAQLPTEGLSQLATFPIAPGVERQSELNKQVKLDDALLGSIEVPTLVLGGSEDWIVPPAFLREVAAKLPRGAYEELQTGHFAILENPAALADRIGSFVSEPRGSA